MNQLEPITIRKALSKGLLAAILLLSLFSFSNNNVYPSHQQVTKTEQVVAARPSKKSYSLNRLSTPRQEIKLVLQVNTILQIHARCIEIQFKNTSKKSFGFQKSIAFLKPQNIYHHSDEDDLNFYRG